MAVMMLREGFLDTPDREVRSYDEFLCGYLEEPEALLERTFRETAATTRWSCCATSLS
jgi:GTP cyclohydrolase I